MSYSTYMRYRRKGLIQDDPIAGLPNASENPSDANPTPRIDAYEHANVYVQGLFAGRQGLAGASGAKPLHMDKPLKVTGPELTALLAQYGALLGGPAAGAGVQG